MVCATQFCLVYNFMGEIDILFYIMIDSRLQVKSHFYLLEVFRC